MKTLLALLLPCVLIGCIPNRLVPHDYSIEKDNLETFIEVDSITVSLINLEIQNDHYIFGLGIKNNADYPIFVDLKKIRKQARNLSFRETESNDYLRETTTAMSPEQVTQFFAKKRANAQAAAAFLFLVGAAISTYDAIKDVSDNSKDYWTAEDEQKAATRDLVTSSTLLAADILTDVAIESGEKANEELRYLPAELFDKEIIYPGEEYYGKVFFKKVIEVHKHHRISFPMEGNNLHFDFRKATPKEKQFLYYGSQ